MVSEIRDRLKDVIISGGENILSVEVESVLLRHPAVQEVAIVGFAHERGREAPRLYCSQAMRALMSASCASFRGRSSRTLRRRTV